MEISKNPKIVLFYYSAISFLDSCPEQMELVCEKDSLTLMFITAKIWGQVRCLPREKYMGQREHYLVI